MNKKKNDILKEQTSKLQEVLEVLSATEENGEFADEINFLEIVKENLKLYDH